MGYRLRAGSKRDGSMTIKQEIEQINRCTEQIREIRLELEEVLGGN